LGTSSIWWRSGYFKTSIEVGATDTTITRAAAGRIAVEGSNVLMASDIGSTVQAYDADLGSWAGVTRASGFDTFAATPSPANLRSLVTGDTGTGDLMFGTSPSVTTDIRPVSHDGATLGTAALGFADLWLATGAVVTWGDASTPDVTLTHSSNTLTFAGASSVYLFDGPLLRVQTTGAITAIQTRRPENHGIAIVGKMEFIGRDNAANDQTYAAIEAVALDDTNGSEDGEFRFSTPVAGTSAIRLVVQNGLQVGSPTGGDKGAGTINAAADIYKNNTAYTNPDYVLEHYYTGKIEKFAQNEGADTYPGLMPLGELETYLRENHHLPRVPRDDGAGIFARADFVLEKLEELFLHVIALEKRLSQLEGHA
jgi:hypothetical protein